jgi:hypothetical protein
MLNQQQSRPELAKLLWLWFKHGCLRTDFFSRSCCCCCCCGSTLAAAHLMAGVHTASPQYLSAGQEQRNTVGIRRCELSC